MSRLECGNELTVANVDGAAEAKVSVAAGTLLAVAVYALIPAG